MAIPLLALFVTLNTAPAEEPSRLAVGASSGGTLDRMSLVVHEENDGTHATWTLSLSTRSREMRELVIPLTVTDDIAITALSLASGTEPLIGEAFAPGRARETYEGLVASIRDPALLERTARDTMLLRVFPVTKELPATVTIEMWLPGGNELALDPGPHRRTVGRRKTWALPPRRVEPEDIRAVTSELSLVAVYPTGQRRHVYARTERSMGTGFHEHVPVTPASIRKDELAELPRL